MHPRLFNNQAATRATLEPEGLPSLASLPASFSADGPELLDCPHRPQYRLFSVRIYFSVNEHHTMHEWRLRRQSRTNCVVTLSSRPTLVDLHVFDDGACGSILGVSAKVNRGQIPPSCMNGRLLHNNTHPTPAPGTH